MIGIFDSGSGGLTVMRAIRDRLPASDILYFGDIRNAPYGSKSRAELSTLTMQAIEFLDKHGATYLVSACNSLSASLAIAVSGDLSIASPNIVEMVGPTVAHFRNMHTRILLCATPATIESEIYQDAFRMIGQEIITMPIPALAGAIEFGAPPEEVERIIKEALASVAIDSFDVVVLACTHYPFVAEIFQQVLGPSRTLFDPAIAVAKRVEEQFSLDASSEGTTRFVISKNSLTFRAYVARLFADTDYMLEVL
jgi:glutamate racemase